MSRLSLNGGAYQARSPIAAAQQQLNLYSEPIPAAEGEPAQMAEFPTPGLSLYATLPIAPVRGIYQASSDPNIYAVGGSTVYRITNSGLVTAIGTITASKTTPVSFADNGLVIVLVDGSAGGWTINISTLAFAAISDPAFYGADKVGYLDTYFVFNRPGTNQFYWSNSLATTFNSLNIIGKSSTSDNLATIAVAKREVWLLGDWASEAFFDSGASDSAFQRIDGVHNGYGTPAKYSVSVIDDRVFFLSQDRHGHGIVMQTEGYQVKRISTYAIESVLSAAFSTLNDAIGFTYQYNGHSFYALSFPSGLGADKTFVYDLSTGLWHQWGWRDPATGLIHRHRGMCAFNVLGTTLIGDRINGNIYNLDMGAFTDNGDPILRLRTFPHIEGNDGQRMFFRQFIVNMAPGTTTGAEPFLTLDWSDDRGQTWSSPLTGTMGAAGKYLTSIQFQRLGMSRSRVFRVSWTAPVDTALLGAFVDVKAGQS